MKGSKDKAVCYGYVGEWADGRLGWCVPKHLGGVTEKQSRKRPEPCAAHPEWSNIGEPSYLCKITIERVPNVRMRRIKP